MATIEAEAVDAFRLETLAERAVIWGMPLVQAGRYWRLLAEGGLEFNQLYMNTRLATPDLNIVGPNIDTLYGFAWIDVASEPQVLSVPEAGDRYYSWQFCDAYLETFAYIGSRVTGSRPGAFALVGPSWSGELPPGVQMVRTPTDRFLAVARTLVRGASDLDAAVSLHRAYALGRLGGYPQGQRRATLRDNALGALPEISLKGSGPAFFDELNALLSRYPPIHPAHQEQLASFAPLGIGPAAADPGPQVARLRAEAVDPALERVRATYFFFSEEHGWKTNKMLRAYGIEDPLVRASVNFAGPAFHLVDEALYYNTTKAADGAPLDGANRYVLRFPAGGLPPVEAFWSLTMYAGNFSLVANPIERYAINSYTAGLERAPDGALEILIQHDRPASGAANWLPAPSGPFMLFIRNYVPEQALIDGAYRMPLPELAQSGTGA